MLWLSNFVIVGTTLASGFVLGDGLDALLKQAQEAAAKGESKAALVLSAWVFNDESHRESKQPADSLNAGHDRNRSAGETTCHSSTHDTPIHFKTQFSPWP
jgi:hypothetical protein